jgi:hypothetical protein
MTRQRFGDQPSRSFNTLARLTLESISIYIHSVRLALVLVHASVDGVDNVGTDGALWVVSSCYSISVLECPMQNLKPMQSISDTK